MNIMVNGNLREVGERATLHTLLCDLDLAKERLAVEHNGEIINRESYALVVLQEEDHLEIVRFVGGG